MQLGATSCDAYCNGIPTNEFRRRRDSADDEEDDLLLHLLDCLLLGTTLTRTEQTWSLAKVKKVWISQWCLWHWLEDALKHPWFDDGVDLPPLRVFKSAEATSGGLSAKARSKAIERRVRFCFNGKTIFQTDLGIPYSWDAHLLSSSAEPNFIGLGFCLHQASSQEEVQVRKVARWFVMDFSESIQSEMVLWIVIWMSRWVRRLRKVGETS